MFNLQIARIIALLFSFLLTFQSVFCQSSCSIRISILTCAPGEELYSTFGHSAIRIIDSTAGTDLVYNYGTFDFSDPDFYTKFVKGKLEYFLSVNNYPNFLYNYQLEQRSIIEQELNLNCNEKQTFYNAILINLQGKNKYYRYDFLYDNCTSRIRDLLQKYTQHFVINKNLTPLKTTFRNLLHEYLDKGNKPWSKLGIDILLGSKIDDTVSNYTAMFLPDYLMKGIDSSQRESILLVAEKKVVYAANMNNKTTNNQYLPFILFSIFSLIIILLSRIKQYWASTIVKATDSLLLYLTGLIGGLLVFMWLGTEHSTCQNNYNLLWALPTNFIAAFFIWKKSGFIRKYFLAVAIIYALTLILWFWLPQQLNISLIPIVILLMYRTVHLCKG